MIDIQAAVFQQLRSDATLAGLLGTYGGVPSVFATPVPDDLVITHEPVCYIGDAINADDDDTYTEEYRRHDLRIRLYQKPDAANGGTTSLKAASERARRVLKDWPKGAISGGVFINASVTGPTLAPTDDPSLAGRLLQVRIYTQEI